MSEPGSEKLKIGKARLDLADSVEKKIRENYTKPFSLEQLAQSIHINKFHMLRTFKSVTGKTPLQYHNFCRCEKAKELLANESLSISFIAIETGFNSSSHFSRVFLNITGQTPSKYRKSLKKKTDDNN